MFPQLLREDRLRVYPQIGSGWVTRPSVPAELIRVGYKTECTRRSGQHWLQDRVYPQLVGREKEVLVYLQPPGERSECTSNFCT